MSAFSAINLDQLPVPQIIDQPTFEEIYALRKARLLELAADFGAPDYIAGLESALELESEPLVQLLQEDSYREMLLRAAVQDAGKGNLLAFASGAVLDHLGAFYGVARLVYQEAEPYAVPPVPEILETDGRLRARIQLAPEGLTSAGSEGSYVFWSLSASASIKDIAVLQTATPGEVRIVALSTEGTGTASPEILTAIDEITEPRRPLNDTVIIESATLVTFSVEAELTLFEGPDAELVRTTAEAALLDFVDQHHRLGHDITVAGLHSALYQPGVQDVELISPVASIVNASDEAAFCTGVTVTVVGRDV